ncbi:MAG: hypothetical protein FJZ59_05320 [Chlamydiae bacterium]|jgi:hypothetical protein|nr:hypothetical protein [Chlamydiota bacterium]
MKKIFFIQVLISAFSFGGVLYAYVSGQNEITKVRIELPKLTREVRLLEEQNLRLRYEIERFENPKHLMELAKRPEFSHLKHPLIGEIFVLQTKEEASQTPQEVINPSRVRSIYVGSGPFSPLEK